MQTKFLLFPCTATFPDYSHTIAHNLSRAGWLFRTHLGGTNKTKPKHTHKKPTYLTTMWMRLFAYSWTLFRQFISISQTPQIIFASRTYFWSIRKTKCFNVSLKFSCLVPLNSEGGDITTGLYKAPRHAVTKRYPRPVDWPNRVKFHKEVVFRNILHYRVDLRQGVQRKGRYCTGSKVASPAFLKSPIIS